MTERDLLQQLVSYGWFVAEVLGTLLGMLAISFWLRWLCRPRNRPENQSWHDLP